MLRLLDKRVLLLGVGSIGSFVAEMLAASGVGTLHLVDSEELVFANASRHLLGADSEGKSKALAVAELLQKRFPHHLVTGAKSEAQATVRAALARDEAYDLVLSLTGDWDLDSFLNQRFLVENKTLRSMLFGWAEPHAVAGHAVLLRSHCSCLQCHFSANGLPDLSVAEWRSETMLTEPACGGQFQPYGIVDIMSTNAMIASVAIDALLDDTTHDIHRVYASSDARIEQTGGEVTALWREARKALSGREAVVLTRDWSAARTCLCCGAADAA